MLSKILSLSLLKFFELKEACAKNEKIKIYDYAKNNVDNNYNKKLKLTFVNSVSYYFFVYLSVEEFKIIKRVV